MTTSRTARSARLAVPLGLLSIAACNGDGPTPPPPPATDCLATADTIPATNLAVGEVRVLAGTAANCVRLVAGNTDAGYLAVVSPVGQTLGQKTSYRLGVDAPGASALMGDLGADAAVRQARLVDALAAGTRMHSVHDRLMARARELDLAGARAERARLAAARTTRAGLPDGIRASIFPTGITPSIGTSAQIRVPSLEDGDHPCQVFTSITATVRHVSERAIIMVDDASPANGFTDADYQAIGTEIDDVIFPTDTAYFGRGSDIDGNTRFVILYTPEVNKATPRNPQDGEGLLAGFFWAGDLFPRTGSGGCNQSNGSEMFYLLVPDPTGIHSGARQVADVREKTRGTVAHEFEHMLNAGARLVNNASSFEAAWLDEALAHMAEEVVGRAKLGVGEFAELNNALVNDVGNGQRDYNAFFFQNLARFDDWLLNPSAEAPVSGGADTSLAVRGAAWALLRYAADHYSGNNVKQFTRRLVAGPGAGLPNLLGHLPSGTTFETLVTGWHVANYADNLPIPGLDVRFTYRSWNMRDAVDALSSIRPYPLAPVLVDTDGTDTGEVHSGGGAMYYRFLVPAGQAGALQLTNGTGTEAGFNGGRLVLLRTQ